MSLIKIIIYFIIIILGINKVIGQTDYPKAREIKHYFGLEAKIEISNSKLKVEDLYKIAPEYKLLYDHLNNLSWRSNDAAGNFYSGKSRATIAFSFYSNKTLKNRFFSDKNTKFHLGYYGVEYGGITSDFDSIESRFGMDLKTNEHITQSLELWGDGFSVGLDQTYSTDKSRRFSFYTGFSTNLGMTIRFKAHYYYQVWKTFPSDFFAFDERIDEKSGDEYVLIPNTTFINFYIPVGINYRISKKEEGFLSDSNIFLDFSYGKEFENHPKLAIKTTSTMALKFGFKMKI